MRTDKERLREFKEIKGAIRKDPNYLIIGIDTAKTKHHACFILSSGKMLAKDISFGNTRYGFERLFYGDKTLWKSECIWNYLWIRIRRKLPKSHLPITSLSRDSM